MTKKMIRLLRSSDAQAFKDLRLASLDEDPLSWLSTKEEEVRLPLISFSNKIQFSVSPPIFGYYGYFLNDELVSYAQLASSFWKKKSHVVTLYDVCVARTARRKGIGTELVKYIIEKTKNFSFIEQIHLWVTSSNIGAKSFYESIGFKQTAVTPKTVKEKDGTYQDEVLYTLVI